MHGAGNRATRLFPGYLLPRPKILGTPGLPSVCKQIRNRDISFAMDLINMHTCLWRN